MAPDEREPDEPDHPPARLESDYFDDRPRYERPHRAGMILAFGIISLVFFQCMIGLVFGILAWVMGNTDLRAMDEGEMDPDGRSLTRTGRILGIVGLIVSGVYTLLVIGYLVVVFAFVAAMPKPAPPVAPPPAPAPAPVPPPPAKGMLVLPGLL